MKYPVGKELFRVNDKEPIAIEVPNTLTGNFIKATTTKEGIVFTWSPVTDLYGLVHIDSYLKSCNFLVKLLLISLSHTAQAPKLDQTVITTN